MPLYRSTPASTRDRGRRTIVPAGAVLVTIALTLLLVSTAGAATVTLNPTDGYDSKNAKTLVQDGKTYLVQRSDNDWFGVEGGHWLSLAFDASVPSAATVQSVTISVEGYGEADLQAGAITWQVGGGSLTSPTVARSFKPPPQPTEATVVWDVTDPIDTPAEVNALRFVVRNDTTNGKKSLLDRVFVTVTYADQPPAPTAPTITSSPGTAASLGQPYGYQGQATGATPITWSLITSPIGMAVSASGLVTWTPSATGSFPVELRATNSVGSATQSFTITVSASPPATRTLEITDGYDAKNAKTLVQDGKTYLVQRSDNDWFGVEAGHWLSLAFQGSLPANATVQTVSVSIEGRDEASLSTGAVTWQVGGGSLTSPTIARSFKPPSQPTEATVVWDVTDPIDTPAEVNALRFVVRNDATNGKKVLVDRVSVQVSYSEQPTAPTITSTPSTSATVNQAYAYQAQASGTTPITWSLVTAPAGMTIGASGLVSWTPSATGSYPVELRASNSVGSTTQSYTLVVSTAPAEAIMLAAGDVADCNSSGDEATATLLDQNPTGTIAALGDLAYESGTAAEFANCYQPTWGRHKARTKPAPGNHEYNTPNATPYYDYFGAAAGTRGQGYYSYDLGAWHVIALNSESDFGAAGAQVAWLKQDLAATSARCVLAYWHKPRYTTGNYNDFAAYQPFWQALYDANAEVVLSGHDHNYQRYRPQNASGALDAARGVRQFVVGSGGRGHYALRADARREAGNDTAFGILKLSLRADSYAWSFIPAAGSSYTDSGTSTCH